MKWNHEPTISIGMIVAACGTILATDLKIETKKGKKTFEYFQSFTAFTIS